MNKKIIIILIVIVSIICIICLCILNALKGKEENNMADNNTIVEVEDILNPDATDIKEDYHIEKERNATRFFTVQNCVQAYIDNINSNNSQAILDILSTTYKDSHTINETNISTLINQYNGDTFTVKEMEILRGDRIFQYRLYGYLTNEQGEQQYMYFKVTTDNLNRTFEIEPFIGEEYQALEDIPLEETNIEEIVENENNTYTYKEITNEEICRIYQRYYTELEMTNPEEAYEMLDAAYREERFPTIEDFRTYLEENREVIEQATLSSYSVNKGDITTRYVIIDSYKNQYILEEESIMNFTIKLDAYTIPDLTYAEDYTELPDSEKASANIGIFMQMINTKDYVHAYEKLADGFKNNYFQTIEQCKEYVNNNWYNVNNYIINSYKNEGNVYIYDVSIKNIRELRQDTTINKSFNVLLGEGTDFTISFNV